MSTRFKSITAAVGPNSSGRCNCFGLAKRPRLRHDRMVELVERMLDLHKRLAAAQTPHEKDLLQRQIAATDAQIDRLVYELYGLTEEEVRLVEGTRD